MVQKNQNPAFLMSERMRIQGSWNSKVQSWDKATPGETARSEWWPGRGLGIEDEAREVGRDLALQIMVKILAFCDTKPM